MQKCSINDLVRIYISRYRLPNETLQIARMGTLLTAFDNGDISKFSRKSLDEIASEGKYF